ncbi:MAG TPA: N-acetyl-gamma-glutamyl-phosphate reductase [Candidatus Cryosericum sp.]|nr:N-acetyl-gamma-glutamyl-phosphate reductase [Candidatus Cryosericum sp.]
MSGNLPVWVVGATGYTGLEAVRLLEAHPYFRLDGVFASPGAVARDLDEIDPAFASRGLRAEPFLPARLESPPAAALLAVPDEVAAVLAPSLRARGVRVVDLSGAFRLRDAAHYPLHYHFEHPQPGLLSEAVYGLSEIARREVRGASLVANPGCYPTASLLAIHPLESAGLLDPDAPVVVDAKSGVTGAGRKADAAYLFAEVSENLRPYRPLSHRHVPEMRQALGYRNGRSLLFVPHLLPVARGLLVTAYVRLRAGVTAFELAAAYGAAYDGSPFVRLLGLGRCPELRGVVRTNRCDLGWVVDEAGRSAVLLAAIDNLLKGAAGQAVQNLNLMHDRPEPEGLPA